jgi:hypothetical protein
MSKHEHVLTFILSLAIAILSGGLMVKYTQEALPWVLAKSFCLFCLSAVAVSCFFGNRK